ncbi:conjugal transfer nickase/helicase domain-containing protein [Pseudomonas sp. FEN]|uniref:conjugal transfer nickase/helicase domain-containing protein n=1 Tax=Pseudomonas sp. FEN TaxID=2767468 RepID=UPI0021E5203B|nr:DNA-binding domain-containing protein [Pseudomonas sp. FEN]
MTWLRQGILKHTITVNDAHAPVHSVAETAFLVTPKIFQRYAQQHLETARMAKEQGTSGWMRSTPGPWIDVWSVRRNYRGASGQPCVRR